MIKCINCIHYPWLPNRQPGVMPLKCHEDLYPRTWTIESANKVNNCGYFEGEIIDEIDEVVQDLVDLQKNTMPVLKEMASKLGLEYHSQIRKPDLIELIKKELEG